MLLRIFFREDDHLNFKSHPYSYTPLHFAVLYLRRKPVDFLVKAGASKARVVRVWEGFWNV